MTTTQAGILFRHLRGLAAAGPISQHPDRQLLERFTVGRDEAAFETLLRRHGPMVLGVCRRVLHDPNDADDAFQATFLVLTRKAASISKRESVGGWLYQVAYNMALKAKASAAARQRHERQAGDRSPVDPLTELTGRELVAVLDEVLQLLPERYRAPLVLCYLEGKTRDEAAQQLGWTMGTLKRRLQQARTSLRRQLERRGLALPAALLAAGLATATVPAALGAATRQAASLLVSGERATVSAPVEALMKGSLAAMTAGKLKAIGAVLLALSLIGAGLLAGGALVADPPQPAAAKDPDRPPQTAAPSPVRDKKEMTVTGAVLGADGKPVAEAVVGLVGRARRQYRSGDPIADRIQLLGEGKADAAGRFRFLARRTSSAHFWEVYAVAAAKGHALGWLRLSPDAEQPQAVLKLQPEQVFRGRLVDLQGVPAAGVKVSVSWVGSVVRGESLGVSLADLPGPSALWPAPVTTDEKGRFVLHGLNRDQGALLRCSADRFAAQSIEVRPVGKPRTGQRTLSMDVGGYIAEHTRGPDEKGQPEEPTITLVAAQVLEGRVVYADTGKPAAKATVLGTSTDTDGRFRIPLTTTKAVTVVVYAPPGTPYLNTYRRVEWPKGAVKHQVEVQLPRGVLVRGKVTEAGTGAPVAGACVQFWPGQWDNPNPRPNVITGWETRELTQADGAFQIAVLAGPGHLLFQGPTPDFIHEEIGSGTLDSGRPGGSRYYPDAAVKLDLPAKSDPKELAVTLRRGVTVRGRLLGADGKPVAKALLLHRLYVYHDLTWHFSTEARDGVFEVHGLDPAKAYPVYFLDAEHQWGAAVSLSGKQAGQEVTVRLVPCGKATARYLNAKGEPLANYRVSPDIVITPVRPDPRDATGKAELAADRGSLTNMDRHNYWDQVKTDAAGRVTFPALIPGATYHLDRWEKNNWVPHKEFTVEAGATIDLGDVTINREE